MGTVATAEKAASSRKLHSGRFTYPGFGADASTFRLNAYGRGEGDARYTSAAALGLRVAGPRGASIDPAATEEREVKPADVAIAKRRLSRGKLARLRNAALAGKALTSDADPILCREHGGALVALKGAHRVAVATIEGYPATLKVRVEKRRTAKSEEATTPKPATEPATTAPAPSTVDRMVARPSKLARRMSTLAGQLADATDARVLTAGMMVRTHTRRLARAKRAPADELAALKDLRDVVVRELKRRGIETFSLAGRPAAKGTPAEEFTERTTGISIPEAHPEPTGADLLEDAADTGTTLAERRAKLNAKRQKARAAMTTR